MSMIGAAAGIAGLVTALNVGAATVKNVAGAAKEAGEVVNNAYEGAKKLASDIKEAAGKNESTSKREGKYKKYRYDRKENK